MTQFFSIQQVTCYILFYYIILYHIILYYIIAKKVKYLIQNLEPASFLLLPILTFFSEPGSSRAVLGES